jgi:hypothetical protein
MGISYRPYERRLKSRRNHIETYAGFEFHHSDSSAPISFNNSSNTSDTIQPPPPPTHHLSRWRRLGSFLSLKRTRLPASLASGSACFGVHASLRSRQAGPRYARRSRNSPTRARSTMGTTAVSAGMSCEATSRSAKQARFPRDRRHREDGGWGVVGCYRFSIGT